MAAAAAPWTERVRDWAVEAEAHRDHARRLLRGAAVLLAPPMHVADAPGGRARAGHVLSTLLDACSDLAVAAADPTDPLPSVADIPADAHESERRALGMLREARVYAEGAYDTAGLCGARLLTAYNLLDRPGLPGVDGFVDAERAAALGYLVTAENLAGVSAAYAYAALRLLFPEMD